jgi:hypothetical protein
MDDDHHNISMKLSEERLNELVDLAKDYAVGHGMYLLNLCKKTGLLCV